MVIIRPALRISGCAQGSSELSYRQVAARDYRVPEATDRHSVNSKATKKVKKVGISWNPESSRYCGKRSVQTRIC